MEQKLVKVPFEVELAKKIANGEVDGRIVTRDGRNARIICWDRKPSSVYNIVALLYENEIELIFTYAVNGFEVVDVESDNDLMLEIPEYMTFKDGDVLTYRPNGYRWCIFIYKGDDCGLMHNYVTYDCDSRGNNILTFGKSSYTSTLCESSTEEEKQKLIDALKESKDQRAKEYLKRFFPNHSNSPKIRKECEFNPFDKVLVRDDYKDSKWSCEFFSHKNEDGLYVCIGQIWEKCIPYEGNEHLLGTTDKMEEK